MWRYIFHIQFLASLGNDFTSVFFRRHRLGLIIYKGWISSIWMICAYVFCVKDAKPILTFRMCIYNIVLSQVLSNFEVLCGLYQHYCDVIMGAMVLVITSLTIVYSTVHSGPDKKTSKLRVTGLCTGNFPMTGQFPAKRASNAEYISNWWRHHGEMTMCKVSLALSQWLSSVPGT